MNTTPNLCGTKWLPWQRRLPTYRAIKSELLAKYFKNAKMQIVKRSIIVSEMTHTAQALQEIQGKNDGRDLSSNVS